MLTLTRHPLTVAARTGIAFFGMALGMPGIALGAAPPQENPPPDITGKWVPLFDGKSLDAWRGFRQKGVPSNWSIEGKTLMTRGGGASLVTREEFGDFDLRFEWRVSANSNSGVLYWVNESEPYAPNTGPEYQVIDDGYFNSPRPLQMAGSLYALYPAKEAVTPKPIGEWNTGRIHAQKGRVRHWLNGGLVVDARYRSDNWWSRVARSKFAQAKAFAKTPRGRLLLQEHGTPVWYREIHVRRLD